MPKPRRTVLSGIVTPFSRAEETPVEQATAPIGENAKPVRRSATKDATIQQTVYLPPPVHEQLRELAFSERVKMHTLIIEGLDAVFKARGLKPIVDLTSKS